MIYRSRDSRAVSAWIADKRGAYTHGGETVCAGFCLYRGFVGCPAWAAGQPCEYCYLKQTFWPDPELREGVAWVDAQTDEPIRCLWCGTEFYPGDLDQVLYHEQVPHRPLTAGEQALALCDSRQMQTVNAARAAVEKWLKPSTEKTVLPQAGLGHGDLIFHLRRDTQVLNGGELGDSLGFPPDDNPHIGMLLDLFSSPETNPHANKVLFVSKAGLRATQAHLQGRAPSENVILSWSVGNAVNEEPGWENVWAPEGRWQASAQMIEAGWRVRWRVDPLVAHGGSHAPSIWCTDLVRQSSRYVNREMRPELVTLGTLRHRGGRLKLPAEERAGIYRDAIEGLRAGGYEGPVGLCKETPEVIRRVLGIEPREMKCNCLP